MTKLHHTIKENKDTIILEFELKELENLPIKVAMKTLEILEDNNRMIGYFVEFSPEIQSFIDKNKEVYKKDCDKECENFKKLSKVYFDYMKGPLYVYGERVLENVIKVYEIEPLVFDIDVKIRVPKIIYTLENEEDSVFDKVLKVKNLEELIEKFGKAITLHTLILFKDHLNYEYQLTNKVAKTPYGISKNIKIECFNKDKQSHELLEVLTGKNYVLEQHFDSHMKNINTPEEILELIIIRENLKNCLKNPEDKYEAKPNPAMPTDVWYLKNNIIHREGDLPARESKDGGQWYKNGLVHRDDDLPASTSSDSKAWYKNGLCHRENDLPAQITGNGRTKSWYKEGKMHREGAPAMIEEAFSFYMSQEQWWHEGKKHRIDGPAVIIGKGKEDKEIKEYWLEGRQIPEQDFEHELEKRHLHEKLQVELVPLKRKEKKVKI